MQRQAVLGNAKGVSQKQPRIQSRILNAPRPQARDGRTQRLIRDHPSISASLAA
jgi:hypothetical protein